MKHSTRLLATSTALITALSLGACSSMTPTQQRVAASVAGGAAGAAIGEKAIGGPEGAAIGAAIGAGVSTAVTESQR